MGLGSSLGGVLDPGGLFTGGLSGETAGDAAAAAAEITNEELMRQFELSQTNLRPSLEAAQRQLPGIQEQLTPGGFERTLSGLAPELQQFLSPTIAGRSQAGSDQLRAAGLSPGADISSALGEIDPNTMANLLMGAEADLFGNRLALSGLGEGAGTVLSELGQRTGAGIAQSNQQAQQAQQAATQQGQSNALGLVGLGASFFSDERLKDNIKELGNYKGLRIISWTWKDLVPESWRNIDIGFSAQDVLDTYPQFVREKNGFLAIDRAGLINHLEAI